MKKKTSIFFISLIWGCSVADASVDLLPEGRSWSYERYIAYRNSGEEQLLNDCRFDGSETHGDKTYKVFRDGDGNVLGLLRQEELKVYRYVDTELAELFSIDNAVKVTEGEEILLYDFGLADGESADMFVQNYGIPDGDVFSVNARFEDGYDLSVNGISTPRQLLACQDNSSPYGDLITVAGIGANHGLLTMPEMRIMGYSGSVYPSAWTLSEVKDSEGRVIFRDHDFYGKEGDTTGASHTFPVDMVWEYYSEGSLNEHSMTRMAFVGTEEYDGRTYQIFKTLSKRTWTGSLNLDGTWNASNVNEIVPESEGSLMRLDSYDVYLLLKAGDNVEKGDLDVEESVVGTVSEPTEVCIFNQKPLLGNSFMCIVSVDLNSWEWVNSKVLFREEILVGERPYYLLMMGGNSDWLTDFGPLFGGTLAAPSGEYLLPISQNIDWILPKLNNIYNANGERVYTGCNYPVPELSGVSTIGLEEASSQTECFTLEGIRVAEPQPGQLLIRRQGSKADKVIF